MRLDKRQLASARDLRRRGHQALVVVAIGRLQPCFALVIHTVGPVEGRTLPPAGLGIHQTDIIASSTRKTPSAKASGNAAEVIEQQRSSALLSALHEPVHGTQRTKPLISDDVRFWGQSRHLQCSDVMCAGYPTRTIADQLRAAVGGLERGPQRAIS